MRLIKWVIMISCSLLLFGCFDNIEQKEQDLKQQGNELAKTYIQYKLKNFVKLNPGASAYCVDGNCLAVFFDSKNIKYEKKDNRYVLFYRQYNLVKYHYEIDSITYGSVTKKDNKLVSEITLKLKLQYEKTSDLPGIKIGMVPEECLSGLAIKNESIDHFLKNEAQLLPSNSFCYGKHLKKTKGVAGLETTEKIYVVWNEKTQKWDFAITFDSNHGDIQFFDATAPKYSQEALDNIMKDNQLFLFKNDYFKQSDVENLQNLEKGLIKINENWISANEYRDTKDLKEAFEKYQNDKMSFADLCKVMQKKTHASKEVIDEIADYSISKIIEAIKNYKKSLNIKEITKLKNALLTLKENNILNVFCTPEVFEEIEKAEQYIAQQNEKALKEKLTNQLSAVLQMRKMSLTLFKNYLDTFNKLPERKTITASEIDTLLDKNFFKISFDKELNLWIKQYTFLQILRMRDRVKYLEDFENDSAVSSLTMQFLEKCDKCRNGIVICKHCKGSKVCVVCEGRGSYTIETIDGRKRVNCPRTCEQCKIPKKCYTCYGQNFKLINADQLPNEIAKYKTKIKERLELILESHQKEIDEISAAIQSDDMKEMQRVLSKLKSSK